MTYLYMVKCRVCGDTYEQSSVEIHPLGLPPRCAECGEYPNWELYYGRFERTHPFKLFSPSTWFAYGFVVKEEYKQSKLIRNSWERIGLATPSQQQESEG